jgi:hypothetical protein
VSIIRETCYLLGCDDCRTTAGEDDDEGYQLHLSTDREALDWAIDHGWTLTDTGHTRCRRCTARALCASFGHVWDFWQPCRCTGRIPSHATTGCPLIRMCLQCGHQDVATLASLPTV